MDKKTIKMCTDLPQSKKLAEFLPLESADMYWGFSGKRYYIEAIDDCDFNEEGDIRAWSLASLLNVIPKHIKGFNVLRIDISTNDFSIWYEEIGFGVSNELPDITRASAVDACFEMILNLHEQKLL